MSDNVREIAERIRALREMEDISDEEMASECGLSVEEYRVFERGEMDFSIGAVFSIASKLGVDVVEIMSGTAPKLSTCALVRQGDGYKVSRVEDYEYRHLAYTFRHKKAEPFMVTVQPRKDGYMPELNSHEGQEFEYIIEGTLGLKVGEHNYVLNAGDTIYFDSKLPHALTALGGKQTKLIAIVMK